MGENLKIWSLNSPKWRESVAPIISPGATNASGKTSRIVVLTSLYCGDVVEIITAPGARPNPAWLGMVRTGRARSKIRHHLKGMEAEESRGLGEKMLAQALRAEGLQMPASDPSDTAAAALWQQLTRWSGNRNRGELMVDIGLGRKIAIIVAKRLAQLMVERGSRPDAVTLTLGVLDPVAIDTLLHRVLGAPLDGVAAAELLRTSGGNPLYLRELVIGAVAEGSLRDVVGVWRLSGSFSAGEALGGRLLDRVGDRELAPRVAAGRLGPGHAQLDAVVTPAQLVAVEVAHARDAQVDGVQHERTRVGASPRERVRDRAAQARARELDGEVDVEVNRLDAEVGRIVRLGARQRELARAVTGGAGTAGMVGTAGEAGLDAMLVHEFVSALVKSG